MKTSGHKLSSGPSMFYINLPPKSSSRKSLTFSAKLTVSFFLISDEITA